MVLRSCRAQEVESEGAKALEVGTKGQLAGGTPSQHKGLTSEWKGSSRTATEHFVLG